MRRNIPLITHTWCCLTVAICGDALKTPPNRHLTAGPGGVRHRTLQPRGGRRLFPRLAAHGWIRGQGHRRLRSVHDRRRGFPYERITPEGGYPDVLLPGFVLMGLGVGFSAVASTTGGTSALITLILIHAKATGDSESRALAKGSRQ